MRANILMKLQYASDLHLEFGENSRWLKDNPLIPSADILVLAGDIGYLGDANYKTHPFWDWASLNYKQVIVVPGNHELYKFLTSMNCMKVGSSTYDIMSRHITTVSYLLMKNRTYCLNPLGEDPSVGRISDRALRQRLQTH